MVDRFAIGDARAYRGPAVGSIVSPGGFGLTLVRTGAYAMSLAKKMIGTNLVGAAALLLLGLASAYGFARVRAHWIDYQRTVSIERHELQTVATEMGYTGLIHDLKNLVLRGNTSYHEDVVYHHKRIHQSLDRYAKVEGLEENDLEAIELLREMADRYLAAADRVAQAQSSPVGVPASDIAGIDAMVRINDTPYKQAMDTLRTNADARAKQYEYELTTFLGRTLLVVGVLTLLGLVAVVGVGGLLCRRIATTTLREQEQLTEQRLKAEAASLAKSQFLANVSHEVRTPMTAILGFADLLEEPDCDSQARQEYVETIRRNGEHLISILNDVLDLSKIEAGRMTIEPRSVELRELVEEVLSLMRPRAQQRDLTFEAEFMPGVPETICTDPLRLRQVLVNLVGNAIKFTEEGGVRVIIRGNRQHSWLSVEVIDSGVGISPQKLDKLFQPFEQGEAGMARRYGGSGLGLALCKRFIEMLGGRLSVASTLGEGSAFWFNLPTTLQEGAQPADAAPAMSTDASVAKPVDEPALPPVPKTLVPLAGRVLLAEDGPDNQRLIRHLLTGLGLEVDLVDNGKDAVDHALRARDDGRPYDLIFMDMQMPVLDGYAATTQLRAAGYRWPIVALTAHAMHEDFGRCIDAGCDDYASKPIDKARLHAVYLEATERKQVA